MDSLRAEELKKIASEVRKDVLRMIGVARSGPFATSVSAADLLVYLYWEELSINLGERTPRARDRFITDVTDVVPALYATLARRGFFEREHLWHYRRLGALLQALPDYGRTPGIDAPCLVAQPAVAMAAEVANALSLSKDAPRVVFFTDARRLGLPEVAAEFKRIGRERASNLIAVISCGEARERGAAKEKKLLSSFGWKTDVANCRDFEAMSDAFCRFRGQDAPKALFAVVKDESAVLFPETQNALGQGRISMGELDDALEELEVKSNAD